METAQLLQELQSFGNEHNRAGMSRFGINTENAYGVSIPIIRAIAKRYKRDHSLALELWNTGIHEARLLAVFVEEPKQVSVNQMEVWVKDFNSWDLCDQTCGNLFIKTPVAYQKAVEWTYRSEEFVKRAGFSMMAYLAVHDKKATDNTFLELFPHIEREAKDSRNYVKKAVNWALRQIGKRTTFLRSEAIELASRIKEQPFTSARWIASDALRELQKKSLVAQE
ncbi:DNA alkylation repair protein [Rhodocytophaga aerolata]|uniref:DNA alkylation repair protein n=1 Tax=Rhodocytophaga aerolata TaxID=455078 RepID=A0ABT8R4J0_9BACT|nr:DNA alkylation repair protein [Rhodocytophaga aerolata]MDO1446143.1 DNA alkylation repair protein [Rhodocytophaga aerolata]